MSAALQRPQPGFLNGEEAALGESFITAGHVIVPVEDEAGLERLRAAMAEAAAAHLDLAKPVDPGRFLDEIHRQVTPERLNPLRLKVIEAVNALPWARQTYFRLARRALETLVGNELVMQRRLNLSIQLPGDDSSLLGVHADVWDGDSPFEVVAWLPLVDCYATKSMYLLAPEKGRAVEAAFGRFQGGSESDLFQAIEGDVEWLSVPFGKILLFSQNLMHGNVVNREATSRWSMNCRFKSLFSPYAGKRLGEFFEPISIRAATRLGMGYRFPEGLHE